MRQHRLRRDGHDEERGVHMPARGPGERERDGAGRAAGGEPDEADAGDREGEDVRGFSGERMSVHGLLDLAGAEAEE